MACSSYIRFNGFKVCIDIAHKPLTWPPDDPRKRLLDLIEELVGPHPDPWVINDPFKSIEIAGIEFGEWSRDVARVSALASIVREIESPALREQVGAVLRDSANQMLAEQGIEAELHVSV